MNSQLERIFMKVQKPGRYTGGELNSVVKDPAAVDFPICFLLSRICMKWECPIWA